MLGFVILLNLFHQLPLNMYKLSFINTYMTSHDTLITWSHVSHTSSYYCDTPVIFTIFSCCRVNGLLDANFISDS